MEWGFLLFALLVRYSATALQFVGSILSASKMVLYYIYYILYIMFLGF